MYNLYIHLYGDGFDEMYSALMGNIEKQKKRAFSFQKRLSWQGQKDSNPQQRFWRTARFAVACATAEGKPETHLNCRTKTHL